MLDYDPDHLEVRVAELLVATADGADDSVDDSVHEVLRLLREKLEMDVVFVSEFVDGKRVFRHVEQSRKLLEEGASDPLEATWCQRVVDGRLPEFIKEAEAFVQSGQAPEQPFDIGTFLSTPIRTGDGNVFGTLCCFSLNVNGNADPADVQRLRFTAQLLAQRLEKRRVAEAERLRKQQDLSLEPRAEDTFRGKL